MTDYEFGDVILIPFPFTNQTTAKRRPAVVVSSTAYHRNRPDLILMPITSRIRPSPSFGETTVDQWETAGLIKPSFIKPIFATVEKGIVIRKMGRLSDQDQQNLRKSIPAILG
jgi:mRNA interferase MazF